MQSLFKKKPKPKALQRKPKWVKETLIAQANPAKNSFLVVIVSNIGTADCLNAVALQAYST